MSRQQSETEADDDRPQRGMPSRRRGKFEVWFRRKDGRDGRWRTYDDRAIAEKAMAGFRVKYGFWSWEIREQIKT